MGKLNLAVMFGSRTVEHDVSIVSALQLIDAVDREHYDVTPIYISREGLWYTGEPLQSIETFKDFNPLGKGITRVILDTTAGAGDLWAWPPQRPGLFASVPKPLAHIDCFVPVFHGLHGEDGTVQGLLELANLPYTCTGVLGSSVGMDKIAMKQLLRGAGLPVLDFIWFTRDDLQAEREAIFDRIEAELHYPVFVKPAALGSSIGIGRADDRAQLEKAVEIAAMYDRRILVETGVVHPTEINCAAIGYDRDVQTSVLEMPMSSGDDEFLTFWEKYLRNADAQGQSRGMKSLSRVVPAPIGEPLTTRIQEMTREVFRLLDCKGVIRVDFLLDQNDVLYVGEPNTIPGSLAFYLWKAQGISYPDLIEKMVENAMCAWAGKNKNVYAFDSNILTSVVRGAKGSKR